MGERKEITIEATIENIAVVTEVVEETLSSAGCPMKAQIQINIALDEILSNIARYAYVPGTGDATVVIETEENAAVITFIDSGMQYNPLEREDPDVTLSAEERGIGGLGIYMVKQSMDDMTYKYRDGHNILTIKKKFS